MRDLHDEHVSDMMLDLTGVRAPVPPVAAAPATHVHAGAGNGAGEFPMRFTLNYDAPQTFADACRVYDACVALARAEPSVPVAGWFPWVESDDDYRRRLTLALRPMFGFELCTSEGLDNVGRTAGLPRARLVRAEHDA